MIARLIGEQPEDRNSKRVKAVNKLRNLLRQATDEVAEFDGKIVRKPEGQGKEAGGEKAPAIGLGIDLTH